MGKRFWSIVCGFGISVLVHGWPDLDCDCESGPALREFGIKDHPHLDPLPEGEAIVVKALYSTAMTGNLVFSFRLDRERFGPE